MRRGDACPVHGEGWPCMPGHRHEYRRFVYGHRLYAEWAGCVHCRHKERLVNLVPRP